MDIPTCKTALITASGPSLSDEDIAAFEGKVDLTIVVNDSYQRVSFANILYACDRHWWQYYNGVPDFKGIKISLQKTNYDDIFSLINEGTPHLSFEWPKIRTGKNGGYQATNLAILLGAKQIFWLGIDCKPDEKKRDHYFGDHPAKIRKGMPYKEWIYYFHTMKESLEGKGVEIINCNPDSAVDAFPRMTVSEALKRINHENQSCRS